MATGVVQLDGELPPPACAAAVAARCDAGFQHCSGCPWMRFRNIILRKQALERRGRKAKEGC